MPVVPFAPVAHSSNDKPCADGDRDALVERLLGLSERARLNGDQEQADQLLLAAWAAYDDPASAPDLTDRGALQDNAPSPGHDQSQPA